MDNGSRSSQQVGKCWQFLHFCESDMIDNINLLLDNNINITYSFFVNSRHFNKQFKSTL